MSIKVLNKLDREIQGIFGTKKNTRSTRKWCVKTPSGRVLSRHSSKAGALAKASCMSSTVKVSRISGGKATVVNGRASASRKRRKTVRRSRRTAKRKTYRRR